MRGLKKLCLVGAMALGLVAPAVAQNRTFYAEGSDTTLMLGARTSALGGTGTASADDATAIFFNPALLTQFDSPTFSIDRQHNQKLRPYNFIGGVIPLTFLDKTGWNASVGFARYTRVHVRSTGAFHAWEPQSAYLRLLLPGVAGTYDGNIDSKTMAWRFAAGLSHDEIPGLSLGFTLDRIDCKTNACGVHAKSNGFETKSFEAYAWAVSLGASYQVNDRLKVAAAYQDINTIIHFESITTDDLGTRTLIASTPLPSKLAFEAEWQAKDWLRLIGGYQRISGSYGFTKMVMATVHVGAEATWGDHWTFRAGGWRPVKMEFTNNIDLKIPIPVIPTLGVGYERDGWSLDAALIADPLMTMHNNRPTPQVKLTLGYTF